MTVHVERSERGIDSVLDNLDFDVVMIVYGLYGRIGV